MVSSTSDSNSDERAFTLSDQDRFAALSGDCNPLHLDLSVARRSMLGGVAVHGIHLVLWALDVLAARFSFSGIAQLRVNFDRGVMVGEKVHCTWTSEGNRWTGRIAGDHGTLVRLGVVAMTIPPGVWTGATHAPSTVCVDREIEELIDLAGDLELSLPEPWREMFPHLAATVVPAMVAFLLASTRLVGMVCPGRHSIYSALRLDWVAPQDPAGLHPSRLHYKVVRADARVRVVDLAVEAGPMRGTINTLVRPKPFAQPRLAEILSKVTPFSFSRQRALVIGGSRGLGELAAKLLVAGGARVTLTWCHGEADAQALLDEAQSLGVGFEALRFDAMAPPDAAPLPSQRYTHLYYFATPHIAHGDPGKFNPAIFTKYLASYVEGFARTVRWFQARAENDAWVWYPSTAFLDDTNPAFAEYCAAKACGEVLCRQLALQLAPMKFVAPRLPRLPTDQTQALTASPLGDGAEILLSALRFLTTA